MKEEVAAIVAPIIISLFRVEWDRFILGQLRTLGIETPKAILLQLLSESNTGARRQCFLYYFILYPFIVVLSPQRQFSPRPTRTQSINKSRPLVETPVAARGQMEHWSGLALDSKTAQKALGREALRQPTVPGLPTDAYTSTSVQVKRRKLASPPPHNDATSLPNGFAFPHKSW